MSKIDVSIVIVSYNTENITYECVNSIFNSIKIFPNPSDGVVQIEFNDSSLKKIEVFDLNGKVINTIENTLEIVKFEINKGLYILKISQFDKVYYNKLIVNYSFLILLRYGK